MTRLRGAVLAGALSLAACTSTVDGAPSSPVRTPDATAAAPSHSAPRSSPPRSHPATPTPPPSATAASIFARMSERERIGQLLMVDCPTAGVTSATAEAISQDGVGAVILDGTSYAGVTAIAHLTVSLRGLVPGRAGLLVATDQEGGQVQRLQGDGFTQIVSAVQQGTIDPSVLEGYARGWAGELRQAGVDVNLAPVLDTVPAGFGSNPPIGDLDRQFGSTPSVVSAHGVAVVRGELDGGIAVTVKHFPGLGRVRGNTDTSSGVTDDVTTRNDPYLAPFQAAVNAGAPLVMMSTAIYARIDPHNPAAFSPTIVTGMLRGDLGFRGLIISDDLGGAGQVSGYSVGERAVLFVAAGGDVVLTVDAGEAGTMIDALAARAGSDPSFRAKVNAAALLVLQEKAALGLLG